MKSAVALEFSEIAATALVCIAFIALGWRQLMRRLEHAHVADWGGKWLNRLDGLNRLWCRHFHRLHGSKMLPLPVSGPALVVANHISGLDPLLLVATSARPLRFLVAQEEYDRPLLRALFRAIGCIPVRRDRNPRAALAAARRSLERGEVVALFPQGRIHLDHEPPVRLKRGVAYLAQATGVPVIAVHVDGIRGAGRTVTAVFMRSRARLKHFPVLHLREGGDSEHFLRDLQGLLGGK